MVSDVISLSDTKQTVYFRKRGHWGGTDNRMMDDSFRSGETKLLPLNGHRLSICFEKTFAELSLRLIDFNGTVWLEETISSEKNGTYTLPVAIEQDKRYLIMITDKDACYYLDFVTQL